MRIQKILKNCAIIFFIICIVILAIDLFKVLKINFDFMGMQSAERISSSSKADEVRYEPTDYKIANKDEALEEIKNITLKLKENHVNSENVEELFEIANINKIEPFFYEYEKYAIVKYKLLNIIEDLPKLHKEINGFGNTGLKNYFNNNVAYIENYYGITSSDKFISFASSLDFLGDSKVEIAIVEDVTIEFDYDNDLLKFNMKIIADNGNSEVFAVKSDYYKTSNNQINPYVTLMIN